METRDPTALNFGWLLRLRWGAVVGQTAIIVAVHEWMAIDLPLAALFALIGLEAATNLGLWLWSRRARRVSEATVAGVLAFDMLLLTALLFFSGGPFNPFSFLYLVHLALAAVVLRPRWVWGLLVISAAAFGLLFVFPGPQAGTAESHALQMRIHLQGMWVAFAVAAVFIVYFLNRITSALSALDRELIAARAHTARSEKLASLATLAAGAAHELSTPLATIAVVARELERGLGGEGEAADDARLIRQQVERCRAILLQMASDAGAGTGEAVVPVRLDALVQIALEGLPGQERVRIERGDDAGAEVRAPVRAVTDALRGVVKNALQASAPEGQVQLKVDRAAGAPRIAVSDRGTGMTPEVQARAGEPFFTTKAPGEGMGLGLFLTRAVLEGLGGRFELVSVPGAGTTASLIFPFPAPASGTRP